MSSYLQDRPFLVLGSVAVAGAIAAAAAALYPSPRRDALSQSFSALCSCLSSCSSASKQEHYDIHLSFNQFIEQQTQVAWKHLLDNVHPSGTAPGCVVASPSKDKPDYWYQWTRDSALCMRPILQRFRLADKGTEDHARLFQLLIDYLDASVDMQHRQTPSGGYTDGGLGEVKFYVNREPFTGPWGRPQRDGPALRASLLLGFAQSLHHSNSQAEAQKVISQKIYEAAKADLDYVAASWKLPDFDLWEEVEGHHFYTIMMQMRALKEGSQYAEAQGDLSSSTKWVEVSKTMDEELDKFWDDKQGYLRGTLQPVNEHGKVSGLDTSVVMASIHAGSHAGRWNVANPKILLTHLAVVESMRHTYAISKAFESSYAVPLGRYCEDVYDGVAMSKANPWYLCTLYHAEYLYRLAAVLESSSIDIPPELHTFYSSLLVQPLNAKNASVPLDSPVHKAITAGLRSRADDFVNIVRTYKEPDGSMSEQFSRLDGSPAGARRLSWSYAAFLSTRAARDVLPNF